MIKEIFFLCSSLIGGIMFALVIISGFYMIVTNFTKSAKINNI